MTTSSLMISPAYIRRFRSIAKNIEDERVNVFIREAEELDIMPSIGAALYEKYRNIGAIVIDDMGSVLQDEQGRDIVLGYEGDLPLHEYKLLNGGFYKDCNGVKQHFTGIKTALAYYAYARFVRAHQAQVTPYGIVVKQGEDSTPASNNQISAMAEEARKIADAYMDRAMDYWHSTGECGKGQQIRKRHYIAIGD